MIYFIQHGDNGPIKIGTTTGSAQKRLCYLQCGNPTELKLLGTLNGGEIEERNLHKRFSESRKRGEWFFASNELLSFITRTTCLPEIDSGMPLRDWRLAQDKTAAEIGALVGVSGVHWTRYETGERKVSINKLHEVSQLTGIPSSELRPDIFKAIEGAA